MTVDIQVDIQTETTKDKPEKPDHSTLISESKFSEIIQSIQSFYPNANLTDGNFTLTSKDLESGNNLRDERRERLYQFLADSDGFLMLVSTNYSKVFGIFVPSNFKTRGYHWTNKPILAFYWIENNSELVTSKRKDNPIYRGSYDADLVDLWAMF